MTEERCENCKFSRPLRWSGELENLMSCHISPPVIVPELLDIENETMTWGFWPHVAVDQWCGEWMPK
jgi:hypothetical protein